MEKSLGEKIAIENTNANARRYHDDFYINGHGTASYAYKTLAWYEKAAENGDASAANMLGDLYWDEEEAEPDYEKAQAYLETIYEYDNFVSKDLKKAEAFYREAQAGGCDGAVWELKEWKERYKHEKNNSIYDLSGAFTGDRLHNRREGAALIVR